LPKKAEERPRNGKPERDVSIKLNGIIGVGGIDYFWVITLAFGDRFSLVSNIGTSASACYHLLSIDRRAAIVLFWTFLEICDIGVLSESYYDRVSVSAFVDQMARAK
jgi:hypothetical protein